MRYDLIVVGGGLAGSALATGMAQVGARVLVLERETLFRDRVRGEGMHPWGVVELRALGLYDEMKRAGALDIPWWATYRGSSPLMKRDLVATTPKQTAALNFSHPTMQEALLRRAEAAGADVRRGATVIRVSSGDPPTVTFDAGGDVQTIPARLVAGADGRQSRVRKWGTFATSEDPKWLRVSGVLLAGMSIDADAVHAVRAPEFGASVLLFPLGGDRCRAYFMNGRRGHNGLPGGTGQFADFVARCVECGVPADWLGSAQQAGPLATFEGADVWVDTPYQEGVVLVGDAAASHDPSWGCGLSLIFRDVRVLRDHLVATDDWKVAASQYARDHDGYYRSLRRIISWLRVILYAVGPEADRIRMTALPRLANGSGPDLPGKGPDNASDDAARTDLLGAGSIPSVDDTVAHAGRAL